MMTKLSHSEIDAQAADWLARRESGPLSPEEQAAFEIWLEADLRNIGSYARAEAVFAEVERTGIAGPDVLRIAPHDRSRRPSRRRLLLSGGIAAVVALAIGGARVVWPLIFRDRYTSRLGEVREVALADGSVVTLNTDSKIIVDLDESARRIHLVRGEAMFDVAKDKERPFIVTAGDTQIRAIGTSFVVQLLPDNPVKVLVREGTVEVTRPEVPEAPPVRLVRNYQAIAFTGKPIAASNIGINQVSRAVAWRQGQIIFDNETLRAAAEEFSRYSTTAVVVDPALADETISGIYASSDPVGFAQAVALSLHLRTAVSENQIRLLR